ncbi:MAG: TonB-dependent hemoglobin/transferrin/lactoferrin family receptor [Porticoccaceae bacterium]|nr:TonB-dependent hemoglobin/transferrin/lactoferrin family receptor [Pseudomonadales bacterium]MCP5170871.1 TonB-dependent hemoglobin/transferrin/lactoferrin family receptor [Pseudomonadales bacterium]MCP5301889.1 TonB-dependent hemoglobin/transferrin/lactoferrin family receptor [Pseudomonadales bacterium]
MNKQALFLTLLALPVSFTVLADERKNQTSSHQSQSGAMENVVVTATRLPRELGDIAGTVSVISAQEIERQVANDLDDLVRYQPGLSMDTAGRGGNQGFIIRGIGGNRVLTLIDGVRSNDIYAAGPASYGRDAFEVDDLKSVEVIRGPASALYGADALGGVVILNTKNPKDYLADGRDTYFALRSQASSADEQGKVGFTAATQQGDWGFIGQYTRRDFHEKEIEGDGELNPQDGSSDALLLKMVWTPSDVHQLGLAFDALQEDVDYQLDSDVSGSVLDSVGRDETERYRLSLSHHWQLGAVFADHIDSHLFWQKTDAIQNTVQQRTSYSFPFAPFGTAAIRDTDFEFNQQVKGGGATLVKSFATGSVQHAMVYGVSYELTDTERPRNRCETDVQFGSQTCDILAFPFSGAESFPNKTFPDTETTRTGIFWQDEMVLGDSGFTLIPGIRYDYYEMDADADSAVGIDGFPVESVTESEVSANFGVIYDLTDEVSLFAQYAEGFRPPNFDEANQSFVNLNFNYATVPNPDLKPETSRGVELGVKASLENAFLSFAIFDNHYDDFIDSQFVGMEGAISQFQDINIGEARIYGAELTANWQLADHWQLNSSIAYAKGDDEEADRPLDSVEPLTGVFGIAYSSTDDTWGVETTLTLVREKTRVSSDTSVTASGYGIVDVFGHYNLTKQAKLKLGVFNLFNKQYARWANLEGLDADSSSVALAQESGTEFRVALDYVF